MDVGKDELRASFLGIDGSEALHTAVIARLPPVKSLLDSGIAALNNVIDTLEQGLEVSASSARAVLRLHDAL